MLAHMLLSYKSVMLYFAKLSLEETEHVKPNYCNLVPIVRSTLQLYIVYAN